MVATLDRLGHRGSIVTLSRNGLRSRGHALAPVDSARRFYSDPEPRAVSLLGRIGAKSRRRGARAVVARGSRRRSLAGPSDLARAAGARAGSHRAPSAENLGRPSLRIAPEVEGLWSGWNGPAAFAGSRRRSTGAEAVADGFDVKTAPPRRSVEVETQRFDVIINTTGPAHRSVIAAEPARSLHQAGLIALDRVGLGLCDGTGRIGPWFERPAGGGPLHRRPLARGTFGELMGLPQVTAYAEHLSETLSAELARPNPPAPASKPGLTVGARERCENAINPSKVIVLSLYTAGLCTRGIAGIRCAAIRSDPNFSSARACRAGWRVLRPGR